MARGEPDREQFSRDAVALLVALRENARAGRSNKLADVKGAVEPSLSIKFETCYSFLRQNGLLDLDRDACLRLTGEGNRVLAEESRGRIKELVDAHFSGRRPENGAQAAASGAAGGAASSAGEGPRNGARAAEAWPGKSGAKPEASERRSLEVDSRFARYDALGQGPLAVVYRGRQSALGLDVAIKELKDLFGYFSFLQRSEVVRRLKREISAQAMVRHPSVLPILDQGCDAARPWFVMELCPGGNLRGRLEAAGGKGLAPDEAVRMFLQLAYGLRAAHAQGVIHANLKPENVLLDALGNVRLADFGLSRIIEVDAAKGMPPIFVGTSGAYSSPEQAERSSRELTAASDVYSAGILLYEMLTGRLPGRRSPLPSGVRSDAPAALDAIFDRMTQEEREQRLPDFDAVLAEVYAAFASGEWGRPGDLILRSCDLCSPARPAREGAAAPSEVAPAAQGA